MRFKQKWHPIWGFRERTKYHTSLIRGGKHPFMLDICCGEDTFQDNIPFRLEQRPQTAWQETKSRRASVVSAVEPDMVLEDVDDADKKADFMGFPFMTNQMSR